MRLGDDRASQLAELDDGLHFQMNTNIFGFRTEVRVQSLLSRSSPASVHDFKKVGNEHLVSPSRRRSTDSFLEGTRRHGEGLQLLQCALYDAFIGTIRDPDLHQSVNATIEDISHPGFRDAIAFIASNFKKSDRDKITIEVVENPHKLSRRFIENIAWLNRTMGFHISVDDLNFSNLLQNNMSRRVLDAIGDYCDEVKVPHEITKYLLHSPPDSYDRQSILQELGFLSRKGKTIVVEGVNKSNIRELHEIFRKLIDPSRLQFQIYNPGNY